MSKKEFKAESKRLLEMMINSIYSQKEVFLRELLSNSSDAIDKIYYKALTDDSLRFNKESYYIKVTPDKTNRTLTITDTGIGMTQEELESSLGTIARSGSLAFKNENETKDGHTIIGQFGVGFYAAFMVADVVTVISKALGSDEAYKWESTGADGYTIEPCEKETVGTQIILKIDVLKDLLLFYSSTEKKLVTLNEYVSRMPEDQKYIYYASGESYDRIEKLPQAELVADKGYEILYFTEDIDEFAIKMLMTYEEKEFKSVSSSDLGIEAEEEQLNESEEKENKELFDYMKKALAGKVGDVRASKRLKTHPVCLSADGEVTIEMEKILSAMPDNQHVKAEKVLEINVNHDVFASLKDAFENDKEKLDLYTNLLYNQALLIEGLSISDPVEFTNDICKIMI
ncbi:ATP-binding protein [Priestia aryabhattai]|uniref:ATP-binding protein n=1 Tax=Priestia aryabhattai TaxID=412384 RepID=UPI0023AFE51C|nr:ATP-binding protein [Priestia aryabhattai]MDE8673979.1 ATP-binding protein [Priestia aryabhattai]